MVKMKDIKLLSLKTGKSSEKDIMNVMANIMLKLMQLIMQMRL
jgi:hypothetical protein